MSSEGRIFTTCTFSTVYDVLEVDGVSETWGSDGDPLLADILCQGDGNMLSFMYNTRDN